MCPSFKCKWFGKKCKSCSGAATACNVSCKDCKRYKVNCSGTK